MPPKTEDWSSAEASNKAQALAAELRATITGEVRFDDGTRALYAVDGSNYRQVPIGVVIPKTIEEVIQTVALARKHGAPLLPRGGGTSLSGQSCNVAVIVDFSKYLNQIIEINPQEKYAWVQPGCVLDKLRNRANEFNLTFGPDPSTHEYCNLGGMIGNNSCGVHSVMAGRTVDNVLELDILTYDGERMRVGPTSDAEYEEIVRAGGRRGEIYSRLRALRDQYADLIRSRYPNIPRRVSGYSLDELLPQRGFNVAKSLVGAEGTCVITLAAKVRLVDWPKKRTTVVLGYKDVYAAADNVPEVCKSKPIGLEGMDDVLISNMKKKGLHPKSIAMLPEGKGWLLCEFGGETKEESNAKARALMETLEPPARSAQHEALYRRAGNAACLESPRVRLGRNVASAGRAGSVGRLGRRSRVAGKTWRIFARASIGCWRNTATIARSTATLATPVSTCALTLIWSQKKASKISALLWKKRLTWL